MSTADAIRAHLRTTECHARYIAGYELDRMTAAELTEFHDDMPVRVAGCRDYPSDYR